MKDGEGTRSHSCFRKIIGVNTKTGLKVGGGTRKPPRRLKGGLYRAEEERPQDLVR